MCEICDQICNQMCITTKYRYHNQMCITQVYMRDTICMTATPQAPAYNNTYISYPYGRPACKLCGSDLVNLIVGIGT